MSIYVTLRILLALAAFSTTAVATPQEFAVRVVWGGETVVADDVATNTVGTNRCVSQNGTHRTLGRLRRTPVQAFQVPDVTARLLGRCAIPKDLAFDSASDPAAFRIRSVLAPISRRGPPSLPLA